MARLAQTQLHPADDFGRFLVSQGYLTARQLLSARAVFGHHGSALATVLRSEGLMSADSIAEASAAFLEVPLVDLSDEPPAPALSTLFDPGLLLRFGVVPWRSAGETITIAAPNIEAYGAFLSRVSGLRASYDVVIAKPEQILQHVATTHRASLTARASARVPASESSRTWERHTNKRRLAITLVCLTLLIGTIALFPQAVFGFFAFWAVATLVISSVMRLSAYVAQVSAPPKDMPPECPTELLPSISVLVPLYKEKEIAEVLVKRLGRLNYPKSKLDVVLAVEENDALTREALAQSALPPWMRTVVVPQGQPQTKPRAMNYALDFCSGDIIGIWDAEDAPDPEQLNIVARYFAHLPKDVVCLQGVLDYYNSRQNWLARCFTIEYATWFRLILPGMARLGFAIPLGGTTLFFKREALEKLGGWDAHNVTEDADLGFRLARHGYRTEPIPTVTGEEANCRAWPWVRQRSRWLKGYLVTYLVHMRNPLKLWKQLGSWKFLGFQAHFVTALSQFVLAPVLWSFWLVLFGLPHPLEPVVARELLIALGVSFLAIEVLNALINATAVSKPGHRHLLVWVPTMHLYYPLGAIAAYKALYELVLKPFYWDKTEHGLSLSQVAVQADLHAASPRPTGVEL